MNNINSILCFRVGDLPGFRKWTYGPVDFSKGPVYAVALVEAPTLLVLGGVVSDSCWPYATVAAGFTAEGWGWCHIEASTKDYIGAALQELKARPGEWWEMVIQYENIQEVESEQLSGHR